MPREFLVRVCAADVPPAPDVLAAVRQHLELAGARRLVCGRSRTGGLMAVFRVTALGHDRARDEAVSMLDHAVRGVTDAPGGVTSDATIALGELVRDPLAAFSGRP